MWPEIRPIIIEGESIVIEIRERKKKVLALSFLISVAWICRFPPFHVSMIPYIGALCGLLRPLIYMGICAAWSVSVSHKIINRPLRRCLKLMAACCILWLFLRTVKYELSPVGTIPYLVLPYCYYFSFILIPTFAFLASLYSGKSEYYKIPGIIWKPIILTSAALILFVFTSPLHRQFWTCISEPFRRGPGYYVVIAWIALLALMTVGVVFIRAKVPEKTKASFLPLLWLITIAIYVILAFFFPEIWKLVSSDFSTFFCIASVGLMQACITSGMIPSNSGYAKVFAAEDKEMIITDDDRNICYCSGGAKQQDMRILKKMEDGVLQIDNHTLLKGCRLNPGYVFWAEDISSLASILSELEQNRAELSYKNELETEAGKTELALFMAQEKNRLYDASQRASAKQNRLLHETLSAYFDETDKNRKKQLLAEAAVLGAYIKRAGNLIFAGDDGSVSARELRLCFHESLSNVELLNADCYLDDALPDEMVLPAQAAMSLYDSYEAAIEAALPDIRFAFVRIKEEGEYIHAIYSIVSSHDLFSAVFPAEASISKEDDTWIISMSMAKEGKEI